jgi:hypothetical protein
MADGICGHVCQNGERLWAGIAASEAFLKSMMKEAEACLGNYVSILNDFQ